MSAGRRRVAILLAGVLVAALIIGIMGVSTVRTVMGVETRAVTDLALEHQGRTAGESVSEEARVEALMALVGDEQAPVEDRNRAIWLLGRLRAAGAESLLVELDVAEECDHERLVCQREVSKALRRIRREDGPFSRIGDLLDGDR